MSHPAPVIELVQPLSVGEQTIAEMWDLFESNSIAYRWDHLPREARERACLAARLPASCAQLKHGGLEPEQKEAVRLALRDLMPAFPAFNGRLSRSEWHRTSRRTAPLTRRAPVVPTNVPPESASRDDLLANRNALMKKINGPIGQHPEPQALYDEE